MSEGEHLERLSLDVTFLEPNPALLDLLTGGMWSRDNPAPQYAVEVRTEHPVPAPRKRRGSTGKRYRAERRHYRRAVRAGTWPTVWRLMFVPSVSLEVPGNA